jgi:hypothetical protein
MGAPSQQTVKQTTKTELDPVLQAHLYGGDLPASAMTGIVPAYFRAPSGSLKGAYETVANLYGDQPRFADGGNVLSLAEQAYQLTTGTDLGAQLPEYEVAAQDPTMMSAYNLGTGGIGSYQPYLQQGVATTQGGVGALQSGLGMVSPAVQQATGMTGGAVQQATGMTGEAVQQATGMTGEAVRQALDMTAPAVQQATGMTTGALRGATGMTTGALRAAQPYQTAAAQMMGLGAETAMGATGGYDPSSYQSFMNPYTEDVIRASEQDAARQAAILGREIGASAVGAGAYGGGREAVARSEAARNIGDQLARTTSQLRQQGYMGAQQQAQTAFEQQQQRQLSGAGLTGQMGQGLGSLGTSYGQLGLQGAGQLGQLGVQSAGQIGQLGLQGAGQIGQLGIEGAGQIGQLGLQGANQMGQLGIQGAGQIGQLGIQGAGQMGQLGLGLGNLGQQQAAFGQQAQQALGSDVSMLQNLGQQQMQYNQAQLDAARMNEYQRVMAPYQQTAFRADILSGSPTGVSGAMTQTSPGPSPLSQIGGLAMAGLGRIYGGE